MPEEITDVAQAEPNVTDSSPEQEQTGNVDQSEKQESKEEIDRKALIKAKQEEVKKRQQAEAERDYYANQLKQTQQQPQKEEEEDLDPDMPLTYADFKRLEEKRQTLEAKRRQNENLARMQTEVVKSVAAVREKYKDTDFTYEDAVEYANANFSTSERSAIATMRNPAQRLYNLVLQESGRIDKIKSKAQQETVTETLNTIKKNLNSPGTLSNVGGASKTMDSLRQMDKKPRNEFLAEMDALIASKG
jgi:hypothetical protein